MRWWACNGRSGHVCCGENGLPKRRLGAGGSARTNLRRATVMQVHAMRCKRMREHARGARKVFSGEMRLRPGPAIRVGASGYVRTRAGQDGHGKQVPGAVFHGECSGGGPGVWPGAAGEIWPDEVRTTGFTLWRLVPDIGWVWAV